MLEVSLQEGLGALQWKVVLLGWDHVSRVRRVCCPCRVDADWCSQHLTALCGTWWVYELLSSTSSEPCLLLWPRVGDGAEEWASMEALPSRAVPWRVNVRCCLAARSALANTDLFNPIWREVGEAGGAFPSLNLVGFSYSRFRIWAVNGAALAQGDG